MGGSGGRPEHGKTGLTKLDAFESGGDITSWANVAVVTKQQVNLLNMATLSSFLALPSNTKLATVPSQNGA